MADLSRELFDKRNGTIDDANRHRRTRGWYIQTVTDAALQHPMIPPMGSIHPQFEDLVLDSFDVSTAPNGMAFVTANYSNDRSFRLPIRVDSLKQSFQSLSVSFRREIHDIPIATRANLKIAGQTTAADYRPEYIDGIEHSQVILQYRVALTSFSFATIDAINGQNGKLHFFRGKWWKFEAGDIVQQDERPPTWETVYSWYSDDGTPLSLFKATNPADEAILKDPRNRPEVPPVDVSQLPRPDGGPLPRLIRSPFHEVRCVICEEVQQNETVELRAKFPQWRGAAIGNANGNPEDFIGDGWKLLPGGLAL